MRTLGAWLLLASLGVASAEDPLGKARDLARSNSPRDHRQAIRLLLKTDSVPAVRLLERVIGASRKALRDMARTLDDADVAYQAAWSRLDRAEERGAGTADLRKEFNTAKRRVKAAQARAVAHLVVMREGGRAFARFQGSASAAEIERGARTEKDPLLRQFYIRALGERQRPGDISVLLELAETKDARMRSVALLALRPVAARKSVHGLAMGLLKAGEWQDRLAAVELVARAPLENAVEGLVAVASTGRGLVETRADDLLFGLTGQSMADDPKNWLAWIQKHRPEIRAGTFRPLKARATIQRGTNTVVSFFRIPIHSTNVAFLVDYSSSMDAELKIPGAAMNELREELGLPETRLGWAKTETIRALRGLPERAMCQLVAFSDEATAFSNRPVAISNGSRKRMEKWLLKSETGWMTNIWDAIRQGYGDYYESRGDAKFKLLPDTLVLLTDGHPTRGRMQDEDPLAFMLNTWNAPVGAVMHTVGLSDGHASNLLERFAADTHGFYLDFNKGMSSFARQRRLLPRRERGPYLARDLPRIREAMRGRDAGDKLSALHALAPAADWIGDPGLFAAGLADGSEEVRQACAKALRALGTRARAQWIAALGMEAPDVMAAAERALRDMPWEAGSEELKELIAQLDAESPATRLATIRILARLKGAPEVAAALTEAASDDDPAVAKAARSAGGVR